MGAGGLCCLCPALDRPLQDTMAFLEVLWKSSDEPGSSGEEQQWGRRPIREESPAGQPLQGHKDDTAGKGSWADPGGSRVEGWQQKGAPRM